MTKVEQNDVLEQVICEPDERDFLQFKLKEVLNESKGGLLKDDFNHEVELKDVAFFETQ